MSPILISLPQDIATRLSKLSSRTGRTESDHIIEAVREHIDDLEDVYLAEERLVELRAGRSRTFPLDQVIKDLDLAD